MAASLALAMAPFTACAEMLPEVVARVLADQPGVQAAQALLQAAEAKVSQARSEFFPTAGLSYRSAKSQDESLGQPLDRSQRRSDASLRWNLFNGGSDIFRLKASKHARGAADADLDEVLELLAAEISENYTDIVRLQATQMALAAVIEQQERLHGLIEKRVEAGRIAPSELDLIRTRMIQNQNLLGQFRAQASSAEHRYRTLTGSPPRNLQFPSLRPGAPELSIDAISEKIAAANPRVRASWQRVAARDAEIGVARGSHFPALDLELSKRISNRTEPVLTSDTDSSTQIRLSLDLPLGGRNLSRQSEAVALHQAARAEAEKLTQDLSRDVGNLAHPLAEARLIAPSLTDRVQAAQRVFFAYERHFNAGRRSIMDLSIALDELFEAQRNLIDNQAQQTTLQARLLSLEGELRRALDSRHVVAPISPTLLSPLPPAAPKGMEAAISVVAGNPQTAEAEPAAAPIDALRQALGQRIETWRSSWMAGDFAGYRQVYIPNFLPADGQTTRDWELQRRERLGRARAPKIAIESLTIREVDQNHAVSEFIQTYASRKFSDRVRKQLTWVRSEGHWFIDAETVVDATGK